ncbi:hypothetical protein XELAEV_18023338mg [Xenopus laevis]|uniref:Uncharacterized protein n=1 Tax=Xenopus laevis TaxID=8355 RepID=A0A974HP04_XENLA|nr:hypothetical protein XELAEV_18023338mg [Xenopus laevis]
MATGAVALISSTQQPRCLNCLSSGHPLILGPPTNVRRTHHLNHSRMRCWPVTDVTPGSTGQRAQESTMFCIECKARF